MADASSSVGRARRHALGDLLPAPPGAPPGKLAVIDGDLRVTFTEFDAAVNLRARALADREPCPQALHLK